MLIAFEGRLSKDDLVRIFKLALKGHIWLTYLFGPLFFLFACLLVISLIYGSPSIYWLMPVVACGFFASYPYWAPVMSANNAYNRQPEMRGLYTGAITEEEILIRTTRTTATLKWSTFTKVSCENDLVLLYQNAQCFNFFPRAFFKSEEDWNSFRAIVDQKTANGTIKETKGKADLTLGLNLPKWAVIGFIALFASPVVCFSLALAMMAIYKAGQ